MKKKMFSISLCLLLILLCGCTFSSKTSDSATLLLISEKYKDKRIEAYDTPYTACFKNGENFDLYIFASPVQMELMGTYYWPHENDIMKTAYGSTENVSIFASNNVFFPSTLDQPISIDKGLINDYADKIELVVKNPEQFGTAQQCLFKNMYGSRVKAVKYKGQDVDMVFYLTNSGLRVEFVSKGEISAKDYEFTLRFDSKKEPVSEEDSSYVSFMDGEKISSVFYAGVSKEKGSNSLNSNTVKVDNVSENEVNLTYHINSPSTHGKKTFLSEMTLDLYSDNIPDSTVYSNVEKSLNLSQHYALNDKEKGTTNHYVEMRLNHFMPIANADNVLSASYYVKSLNDIPKEDLDKIKAYEVLEQWSSNNMSWQNKAKCTGAISSLSKDKNGDTYFDITAFAKTCMSDTTVKKESRGIMIGLEGESDAKNDFWFSTSDNALYPPYVKLTLKAEPTDFKNREKINGVYY